MKPDFALNLSFDGITLLQRVRGGWAALDRAGLDGDLASEMARLRRTARDAGAGDGAIKLIIPDDQIKFLDRPAPDGVPVDAAARAALEGQTPYAVDELRFDVDRRNGRMHIAAVARETLEEAEAFALEHGFAPMGFVAAQGDGFGREVAFGPAESWSGKPLRPEPAPVRIVPLPEPENAPDPQPDPQTEPQPAPPPAAAPESPPPSAGPRDEAAAEPSGDTGDTGTEPRTEPGVEAAPEARADSGADTGNATEQDSGTGLPARDPLAKAIDKAARTDAPAAPSDATETDRETPTPPAPPYPVRARPADPLARPGPPKPGAATRTDTPRATGNVPGDAPDDPAAGKSAFVSMRARRDVPDAPQVPKAPAVVPRAPSVSATPRLSIRPVAADRIDSPDSPDPDVLDSLTRAAPQMPPPVAPSVAEPAATGRTIPAAPRPDDARKAPAIAGIFAKVPGTPGSQAGKSGKSGKSGGPDKVGLGAARLAPASRVPDVTAPVGTAIDTPGLAAAGIGLGSAGLRPGAAADPDASPPQPPDPVAPARKAGRGRLAGLLAAGKKPRAKPQVAAAKSAAEKEAERMTVFGARRKDNYVGGKPRFLGLMLTSALLIFLLGVAAWASVFLEDGLARLFRSAPPTELAAVPDDPLPVVPTAPETSLAPMARPAPAADPVREARLTPPEADPAATPEIAARLPDPLPEPLTAPAPEAAAPRALSAAEAEATYAATGIWQRAPDAPADIRESDAGDLYVASIDPNVPQFDANALPAARPTRDPAYDAPPIPAPAGTLFDLDARGLVRATPEGAVNPDRVRIFAGLPPAVPPLRGDALAPVLEAIPERADGTRPTTTEIFQRVQEYREFRPNPRPDNLQEQNDRANLTGLSRPELADLRPAPRPEALKTALEADITATAQAVAVSERPSSRPANMARLVAAAQARQQAIAAQQATQVASAAAAPAPVAARTMAPSVPSNTSVSKAATETNAINLRQINLIGVYGQPSSRRALVRLSNGRYVKVGIGDRLDGGRVAAIGEDELRYVKGGRNLTLALPRG